jgi:lipopolysaccharide export system permease protein
MQPLPSGAFALERVSERDYTPEAPHERTAAREEVRFAAADAQAFALRAGRPEQMSSPELYEQIELRSRAGLPTARHRLAQHGRFTYPLLGAVGALLAAALALRPNRRAGLTTALVEGLGASAAMWGLLVTGRALALSERVPPWLAAWAPVLVLAAAGLVLLRRADRAS